MNVHSTAIIAGDVNIDSAATVAPYAVITGPVTVGPGAYIGAHAVVGAPAQHHGTAPAPHSADRDGAGIIIGADTCVREFCTIHQGLMGPTRIGADCLVMAGCHVAHDCELGDDVTLGTFSILGGFTSIGDGVTFGQAVVTHPWVVIGDGAMVGLNSSVLRDVDPYAKVAGAPVRSLGVNQKKLGDTVLSADVWEQHAAACELRDERKAAWSANA